MADGIRTRKNEGHNLALFPIELQPHRNRRNLARLGRIELPSLPYQSSSLPLTYNRVALATGIEPAVSALQGRRSTNKSYTSNIGAGPES